MVTSRLADAVVVVILNVAWVVLARMVQVARTVAAPLLLCNATVMFAGAGLLKVTAPLPPLPPVRPVTRREGRAGKDAPRGGGGNGVSSLQSSLQQRERRSNRTNTRCLGAVPKVRAAEKYCYHSTLLRFLC